MAGPGVIGVAVRDDGAPHRPDGIDVEAAGGAEQTRRGRVQPGFKAGGRHLGEGAGG